MILRFSAHTEERLTAAGGVYKTSYDAQGWPLLKTLPNRAALSWTYDAQGRVVSFGSSAPDGSPTRWWSYAYDRFGNMVSASGPPGLFAYEFDELNRVSKIKDAFAKTVQIAYDGPGRVGSVRTPEGEEIRYCYGARGTTESIETSRGKISFAYDASGRLEQISYPGGVKTSYQYLVGFQLKSISCRGGDGSVLYQEDYTYDARGNIASIASGEGTSRFQYDAADRLVAASHAGGEKESFSYDAAGNLTSSQDVKEWIYNADQELIQWGGQKMGQDGAGNLASDGTHRFDWDADGRLRRAVLADGRTVEYAYDPAGRRIEKKSSAGTTRYLYSGSKLIAEYDGEGRLTVSYVPGFGGWSAMQRDGRLYYPVRSHLGSLMAVVDESGKVVKRFRYGSYGRVIASQGALKISPCYAGSSFDEDTGLVLMGARCYSPNLCRFVSPDPVGPDKDGSRYAYALENPLLNVDASGTVVSPHFKYMKDLGVSNLGQWPSWVQGQFQKMVNSPNPVISQLGLQNLDVWDMTTKKDFTAGGLHFGASEPIPGGYQINVNSKLIGERAANAEDFSKRVLDTYTHEAQHIADQAKRIDELVEHGVPREDAIKAVSVDYNLTPPGSSSSVNAYRIELEERAFKSGAQIDPTIGGKFPEGALDANGELTEAVKESIAQKYGRNWPGERSIEIGERNDYLTTKYGMSAEEWEQQGQHAWAANKERWDLFKAAAADEANRGTGAAKEVLDIVSKESRAWVVAAEEALPGLLRRGVTVGDEAITLAARGVNGAAKVIGGVAKKVLPFIGPAIELAMAKDAKDVLRAGVHAIPVVGEAVMAVEMAHDAGKFVGQLAADIYLAAKGKYDAGIKSIEDIAKAMNEPDPEDPDGIKKRKRRAAAGDQGSGLGGPMLVDNFNSNSPGSGASSIPAPGTTLGATTPPSATPPGTTPPGTTPPGTTPPATTPPGAMPPGVIPPASSPSSSPGANPPMTTSNSGKTSTSQGAAGNTTVAKANNTSDRGRRPGVSGSSSDGDDDPQPPASPASPPMSNAGSTSPTTTPPADSADDSNASPDAPTTQPKKTASASKDSKTPDTPPKQPGTTPADPKTPDAPPTQPKPPGTTPTEPKTPYAPAMQPKTPGEPPAEPAQPTTKKNLLDRPLGEDLPDEPVKVAKNDTGKRMGFVQVIEGISQPNRGSKDNGPPSGNDPKPPSMPPTTPPTTPPAPRTPAPPYSQPSDFPSMDPNPKPPAEKPGLFRGIIQSIEGMIKSWFSSDKKETP